MKHYINDIEISPRNRDSIGVVSDFTGSPDVLSLNTESVKLPREAYDLIMAHINTVGLFEGIPYKVTMEGGVTLLYYIDLADGLQISQHEIEVKLKKRFAMDQFREKADGSSFEWLMSKGVNYTTHKVPYFIVKDNAYEQALTTSVVTYIMGKETYEAGVQVAEGIQDLILASTPIPGLSPTGPTVSYNVGAIIVASLKLIAKLVYFGLMLTALIKMAGDLFLLLFPPIRNLLACNFKELLEKSCNYLGYTFKSDLLTNDMNWHLLPVPLIKNRKSIFKFLPDGFNTSFNKGVPSSSDTVATLGQFIDALLVMFNARLYVYNNEVRIERRDWLQNSTNTQILPSLSLQSDRDDSYTFNVDDIWKRYYIHYTVDFQDLHSCDEKLYDFHDAEFSTEPLFTASSPDLINIKGLNDVAIPFSLGARKDTLFWYELLAKGMFKVIDSVTGIFGGGTNYEAQIGSRKDCLMVSQQFFATTKVIYGKVGEVRPNAIVQKSNYLDYCSARALWNKYHYINAIQNNDYIIKENVRIMITPTEFVNLLYNNFAEINGIVCEVLRLEYIDEKSHALITYKEPNGWANNKVNTIVINE
jgi:hypothetical protein